MQQSESSQQVSADGSPVDRIRDHGWRQGSILPPPLLLHVRWDDQDATRDSPIAIVLTGDCNLLHGRLENDPFVDVICGKLIEGADGRFTQAKNPRTLHVPVGAATGEPRVLEVNARGRGTLARATLAEHAPSNEFTLTARAKQTVMDWWAVGRYLRSSLPDQFNRRLSLVNGKRRKLEKLMQAARDEVLAVYVAVRPDDEVNEQSVYDVIVRVVLHREVAESEESFAEVDEHFYGPFIDLLRTAPGFRIVDHDLVSEMTFTLAELRDMKRLELFEYMSYANDSVEEPAVPPRA